MKYSSLIASFAYTISVFANPQNHAVMHGQAQVSEQGALMEVNTGDRAVVSWESFSIAAGETVRFNQPTEHSAILNRVNGPLSSEIMGSLEANGNVYLVNPNGILVGPEGQINTAGFFASVYEVSDTEFMDAESMRISGSELGEIVNLGTIKTANGPVTLIAHRIENLGNIEAPRGVVSCFSGHDLLFDPTGDNILYICPDIKGDGVDQNGRIQALKTVLEADTAPTTLAIGLGGIVSATCIEGVGGEIYLTAKEGSAEVVFGEELPGPEEVTLQTNSEDYSPGTFVDDVYITRTNKFQSLRSLNQIPPGTPLFKVFYKDPPGALSGAALQAVEIALVEPITNPDQIAQVVDGNLTLPSTPDPKTACRTPPVAVQSS